MAPDSMDVSLSELRELVMDREPGVLQSMGSPESLQMVIAAMKLEHAYSLDEKL